MENSTVLTVSGIIVTLLIGGVGIYLVRKKRYPGQITFVKEASLGLFDSIVKNLPELSILYKEVPVGEGLVLLKGALLNTGSKDITETMVAEKLSFNLPEGFKWLTVKVISASPEVKGKVKILPNRITFDTGLFRCNEYIRFDALAEVFILDNAAKRDAHHVEKKLEDALRITHRIADTGKVKTQKLSDTSKSAKLMKPALSTLGVGLVLIFGALALFHLKGWPAETVFLMPTNDNQTVEVRIVPKLDGTVKVKCADERFRKIVPIGDFFQTDGLQAKAVPERGSRLFFSIAAVLYIVFPLILVLCLYIRQKKIRKLHNLLSTSGEAT